MNMNIETCQSHFKKGRGVRDEGINAGNEPNQGTIYAYLENPCVTIIY
jgi:hypothetical protein